MRKNTYIYLAIILLLFLGRAYYLLGNRQIVVPPTQGIYIKIGDKKLNISLKGEGENVLFLHGFPYHSDTFYKLISKDLPGYRFITVDFPGLGFSGRKDKSIITPADLALDIKLLLDKLGIEEVILVGHDLGGGVAIICAALYPSLVKKLVLIAPESSQGFSNIGLAWWQTAPILGEVWSSIGINKSFIRESLKKSWGDLDSNWYKRVENYYWPLTIARNRKNLLALNRGRKGFNYTTYEEQLKTPTLLIWGKEDKIIPANRGKKLLEYLDNSKLEILEGAGHLPQEEVPKMVREILRGFFKK